MAELAGRKELALGHHHTFRMENGRKMAPYPEKKTKRKWRF
jgi:hypothetical protein